MGRDLSTPFGAIAQCRPQTGREGADGRPSEVQDELTEIPVAPLRGVFVLESIRSFLDPFHVLFADIYQGDEGLFGEDRFIDMAVFSESFPVRAFPFSQAHPLVVRGVPWGYPSVSPYINMVLFAYECPGCKDASECPQHGSKFLKEPS